MALILEKTTTGIAGNAGSAAVAASCKVTVPANEYWALTLLHTKMTNGAHVGTRIPSFLIKDPTNIVALAAPSGASGWVASTAYYIEAVVGSGQLQLTLSGTPARLDKCGLPQITIPPGYTIEPYDTATISPTNPTGTATAMAATTMTDSGQAWTTNTFSSRVVTMLSSTATVASNTGTVLTVDAWSPLLSGTADASGATTMTFNAGTWTTNALAGGVVAMGGSTATILSNTGTVLTFAAWAPLAPSTGAFTIIGGYAIAGGDTHELSVFYDKYQQVIV